MRIQDLDQILAMQQYHAYSPEYHFSAILKLRDSMLDKKTEIVARIPTTDYKAKYGPRATVNYEQDWIDTVYVSAAYSHLVATSLSTFIESMLVYEFSNLALNRKYKAPVSSHVRWQLPKEVFWNPKVVANNDGTQLRKKHLVRGSIQLFEALDITNPIGSADWDAVECLLEYRNIVVHGGFEWKKETLEKFSQLIRQKGWQKNFDQATSGKDVWIYYLAESTIETILGLCQPIYLLFENELTEGLNEFYGKK